MSGDRVSRCPLRRRCGPVAGVARMGFFRRRGGQRSQLQNVLLLFCLLLALRRSTEGAGDLLAVLVKLRQRDVRSSGLEASGRGADVALVAAHPQF
ncbi:hypothetical protein F383_10976 [Gossypium arboreum]|uniref:Uncharacterized protein n=1 Tax=Gossypium arboreum TaxID=29729 RepID=A0A0B0MGZ7_GOSAR|nr:hypothetical protein F383_10976 [Gossypium arboreum]